MTRRPFRDIWALKLAGPSAQPRIPNRKSSSVRLNIRRYSSKERPQGTTASYLKAIHVSSHQYARYLTPITQHLTPYTRITSRRELCCNRVRHAGGNL